MRSPITQKNLAFNEYQNICDICRRCEGFRDDNDDEYKCKYNKEHRGLHAGRVKDHMENFKCKYFKRAFKYITSGLRSKQTWSMGTTLYTHQIWKRGKFIKKVEVR